MTKKIKNPIEFTGNIPAATMNQAEFEAELLDRGAVILPFASFLTAGNGWAVLASKNEDFINEIDIDTKTGSANETIEQDTLFGAIKQSRTYSRLEPIKIKVRKKGNEYYYFGPNEKSQVMVMTRV